MKTLLIWDSGEGISLYLIPCAPDWISEAEGLFLNASETTEDQDKLLYRISDAVCEMPDYYMNENDELAGKWVEYKVMSGSVLPVQGECLVITCGWLP